MTKEHPIIEDFLRYLVKESEGLFTDKLAEHFKECVHVDSYRMLELCDDIESNKDYVCNGFVEEEAKKFFLESYQDAKDSFDEFEADEEHFLRGHPSHMNKVDTPVGHMYVIRGCDIKQYPISGFHENSERMAFVVAILRYLVLRTIFIMYFNKLDAVVSKSETKH